MRFFTAILTSAALTGLVSACKQKPVGDTPSGNPIALPGLAQQVEAGTPFTITWNPTTPGGVSIVLLQGPSTNVLPIDCIAESIPNTGKFVWTPSTSLKPDVTHYGLQIIVDGTGQFQYSTQFGISNSAYGHATSHSTTTTKHTNTATSEHTATSTGIAPHTTSSLVVSQISDGQVQGSTANATSQATSPVVVIATISINATHHTGPTAPLPTVASTGAPQHNSTHLRGTKTMTVPKTLQSLISANKTTKTSHVVTTATGATNATSSASSTSAATTAAAAQPSSGASHLGAAGGLIAALAGMMALVL